MRDPSYRLLKPGGYSIQHLGVRSQSVFVCQLKVTFFLARQTDVQRR